MTQGEIKDPNRPIIKEGLENILEPCQENILNPDLLLGKSYQIWKDQIIVILYSENKGHISMYFMHIYA